MPAIGVASDRASHRRRTAPGTASPASERRCRGCRPPPARRRARAAGPAAADAPRTHGAHHDAQTLTTAGRAGQGRHCRSCRRPGSGRPARASGWPISGDGMTRGSRPSPVNSSQPMGTASSGISSQRQGEPIDPAHRHAPAAAATAARRRRSGQAANTAPRATIAPPSQIQPTSGLTKTRSVAAPRVGVVGDQRDVQVLAEGAAHRRRGDRGRGAGIVAQRGRERTRLRTGDRELGARLAHPRIATPAARSPAARGATGRSRSSSSLARAAGSRSASMPMVAETAMAIAMTQMPACTR